VVPSKFFGSLAVGRPVVYVGPDDSDIAQWVSALDVGYTVRQGRLHETVDALHALAASPDALPVMQRRAKRVYDEHFCKEVGLAAWNRLLSQLVGRAGPAAGVR
jgi:hypothetical protein